VWLSQRHEGYCGRTLTAEMHFSIAVETQPSRLSLLSWGVVRDAEAWNVMGGRGPAHSTEGARHVCVLADLERQARLVSDSSLRCCRYGCLVSAMVLGGELRGHVLGCGATSAVRMLDPQRLLSLLPGVVCCMDVLEPSEARRH
jgi:hypothetical protein